MLLDLEVKLHSRDSILQLQSLTHFQFSLPRFINLFKYAWYKCGYIDIRSEEFETFVDFYFKKAMRCLRQYCYNYLRMM